jgi:NAD(P)-dependent dehydrogenase (short-subunit alcohol dehydrogenase family)
VLAHECAPHGVLVNALLVGEIVTDQIVRSTSRWRGRRRWTDYIARLGVRIPIGRMGQADEFARVACFLASDAASYVTGDRDQRGRRAFADSVSRAQGARVPRLMQQIIFW